MTRTANLEKHSKLFAWAWFFLACGSIPVDLEADVIAFGSGDFAVTPVFSNVQTFQFSIDMAVPLVAGTSYTNPVLNGVSYSVSGSLNGTPSGFPGFTLVRNIEGPEFYAQGSSLAFTVSPGANLADGLQVSELSGVEAVFLFDGREVNTGRYHPAILKLNSDGTGNIQNSNNTGGINPVTMKEVDVNFGDEYISDLNFDPLVLTLAFTGCAENQYVSGNLCTPCPPGWVNEAGDDATGSDTACTDLAFFEDGFES